MIKVCANLICFFKGKKNLLSWAVVAHAFNHSTREAEAGGSLSLRPTWSIKRVPGQPGLYRQTLFQKPRKRKRGEKEGRKGGKREGGREEGEKEKII